MAMFKGNTTTPQGSSRSAEINSPDRLNRIVEGTVIQGDITSESNIRIDGKHTGTIQTKGRLVVGSNGHIEGEIRCANADIEGTFIGKISVSEQLALKSTAKLEGDIITGKLSIEPGAKFSGSCSMGGNKTTSTPSATPKVQSAAPKAPAKEAVS